MRTYVSNLYYTVAIIRRIIRKISNNWATQVQVSLVYNELKMHLKFEIDLGTNKSFYVRPKRNVIFLRFMLFGMIVLSVIIWSKGQTCVTC